MALRQSHKSPRRIGVVGKHNMTRRGRNPGLHKEKVEGPEAIAAE